MEKIKHKPYQKYVFRITIILECTVIIESPVIKAMNGPAIWEPWSMFDITILRCVIKH